MSYARLGSLILASESPRRKVLLKKLGIPFRIIPSQLAEPPPGLLTPVAYSRKLALAKAQGVARNLSEGLVLGADTIVVHRGKILGKPVDFAQGCRMLGVLQGTTHRVITAVALVDAKSQKATVRHAVSIVTMRRLSPEAIARHAAKNLDKAGSYAVQEKRDGLVTKIQGSYTNVVGFPLELVRKLLKGLGPLKPGGSLSGRLRRRAVLS